MTRLNQGERFANGFSGSRFDALHEAPASRATQRCGAGSTPDPQDGQELQAGRLGPRLAPGLIQGRRRPDPTRQFRGEEP